MKKVILAIIATVIIAIAGMGAGILYFSISHKKAVETESQIEETEDEEETKSAETATDNPVKVDEPEHEGKEETDNDGAGDLLDKLMGNDESDDEEANVDGDNISNPEYVDVVNDYIAFYNGSKNYNQLMISSYFSGYDSIISYGSYDHPWLGDQSYFTGSDFNESGLQLEAVYIDVNDDGVDELFIVERYGSYIMIHDVWTIANGNLKYLGYWDARFDLILTPELDLYYIGSGGWNCVSFMQYELTSDGQMVVIDDIEMIPGNGEDYSLEHNGVTISEDEYSAWADKYYSLQKNDMTNVKKDIIAAW